MAENPRCALADYSHLVAVPVQRPTVVKSTVTIWSVSPYWGVAEGQVTFIDGVRLRMREELDFADCLITAYGYEVYHHSDHSGGN